MAVDRLSLALALCVIWAFRNPPSAGGRETVMTVHGDPDGAFYSLYLSQQKPYGMSLLCNQTQAALVLLSQTRWFLEHQQ